MWNKYSFLPSTGEYIYTQVPSRDIPPEIIKQCKKYLLNLQICDVYTPSYFSLKMGSGEEWQLGEGVRGFCIAGGEVIRRW